ncbi:MAG: hypothetical protein AB7K71_14450 [Polyangiaceae bacterium]
MTLRSRGETQCVLSVTRAWDGAPLALANHVEFTLEHSGDLSLTVDAPLWTEPALDCPPGRVPELWRYSVAELFIWGGEDRYLELELAPNGHWWLLELSTWRSRCREDLDLDVSFQRGVDRWQATAVIRAALLPPRPWRLSACAIWGEASDRSHAMSHPTLGAMPDFHQPSAFSPSW